MDSAVTDVSVIIVNWNTKEMLAQCLRSVYETKKECGLQVIVVDNGSSDGSAQMIREGFPQVTLIQNSENFGHARANNQGIKASASDLILLLNSDCVVLEGSIAAMVALMRQNPSIGALSAQSLNPDRTLQYPCRRFPTLATVLLDDTCLGWWFPNNRPMYRYRYRDWAQDDFRQVEQPPLTCLMVRRKVFERIGFFDESFFLYFNDPDFCFRMTRAGFESFYTPDARVIHYGGASIRNFSDAAYNWQAGRIRYYAKHFGLYAVLYIKAVLLLDSLIRLAKLGVKIVLGKANAGEMIDYLRFTGRVLGA